jgi:hypothetical protein
VIFKGGLPAHRRRPVMTHLHAIDTLINWCSHFEDKPLTFSPAEQMRMKGTVTSESYQTCRKGSSAVAIITPATMRGTFIAKKSRIAEAIQKRPY